MAEVQHKATGIFALLILDLILSAVLIPIIEIETNIGYTDSVIGAFIIFVIILIFGSASIGAYDLDKKHHWHERVYNRARKTVHRHKKYKK